MLSQHAQSSRFNNYHTPKQRILGSQSAHPAPAWRPNARLASGSNQGPGSKILLSRLPLDVEQEEVEVLFNRTVGQVKEVIMVYNTQGKSRGMAVVTFARAGDAAVARAKYNGKFVDGRRPIKIEIVVDDDEVVNASPPVTGPPSLLERLGPPKPTPNGAHKNPKQAAAVKTGQQPQPQPQPQAPKGPAPTAKVRLRTKKGPRRLNKQQAARQPPRKKTAEELDKEMEEYKASAGGGNGTAVRVKATESTMQMQIS
ncbi:hypothetical protein C8Q77DRAFT_1062034 [Trametes polyzona]|nr:hypothetical protein C8Q77DRAFT_1062034 [Trametes polyzona]